MSETTNNVLVTPRQPEDVCPFQWEICDITCNTKDLLEKHKQGKKHLKSLQNSSYSSANAPKKAPPPVASETLVAEPRQPEHIRPFQCEVCNITCNTKNLLQHKQGKKHLKCLQKLADSSAGAPKEAPPPVANETLVADLENKEHRVLQHGAMADTIYCNLCIVICNNQEIFQKHVAVKKSSDKAIIQLLSKNGFFDTTLCSICGSQKKPSTFQCELCKITCTSIEQLNMHIAGKKHLKKLKQYGQIPILPLMSIASLETPPSEPMVNLESNECITVNSDESNRKEKRAGSHEDVGSKKQKVFCNSPTALIAGQNHAAMAVEQAETPITGQES